GEKAREEEDPKAGKASGEEGQQESEEDGDEDGDEDGSQVGQTSKKGGQSVEITDRDPADAPLLARHEPGRHGRPERPPADFGEQAAAQQDVGRGRRRRGRRHGKRVFKRRRRARRRQPDAGSERRRRYRPGDWREIQ